MFWREVKTPELVRVRELTDELKRHITSHYPKVVLPRSVFPNTKRFLEWQGYTSAERGREQVWTPSRST